MTYATREELEERYGDRVTELADRGHPATGVADPAVIARALADAGAFIDGYLSARYALPIAVTPPFLRDQALIVAIHRLSGTNVPEKIREDYLQTVKVLEGIASGRYQLLDGSGAELPAARAGFGSRAVSAERVFTPDALRGFA